MLTSSDIKSINKIKDAFDEVLTEWGYNYSLSEEDYELICDKVETKVGAGAFDRQFFRSYYNAYIKSIKRILDNFS